MRLLTRKPALAPPSRRQFRLLVAMALLEAVLLGMLWQLTHANPAVGFLIKYGKRYIVAYRDGQTEFEMRQCDSLSEALRFAREELQLSAGHNTVFDHELEHTWVTNRFGASVLLWKTLRYANVNQLTFNSEADARFFLDAFRRGAYSPSLFGHSILLQPLTASLVR